VKIIPLLALAGGILFSSHAFAVEPGVPIQTVNACNDIANQRMLQGTDRQAFVDQCMGPTTVASVESSEDVIPTELRMGCDQEADSRHLRDADRDAFMETCTAAKNTQALTVAAVPVQKLNGCAGEANERRLRDATRDSFIETCLAN
jgi:hypothetical protein